MNLIAVTQAVENMIEFDISEATKRNIDEEVDAISFRWDSRSSRDAGGKISFKYTPGEYEQIVNQQIENLAKIGGYSEDEIKSAMGNEDIAPPTISNTYSTVQKLNMTGYELREKAEQAARLVIKRQKEIAIRKKAIEEAIEKVRKGDEWRATWNHNDFALDEGFVNFFIVYY